MKLTFRILAAVNALLLVVTLFYQSPGEDPAGAGLRMGFAVIYAIALAAVLALYHFVKTPWVRVPMLVLLGLPVISILYGISLSL
jgi:hypothetical protein